MHKDSPTDPQAKPEYWWAREIYSGQVTPVELWKTTSPDFSDTVIMIGDSSGYDAKFYELLEPIPFPKAVRNS
ncbi:hypothetical protein [Muricoccus aerilatus]|uniref:hypothetical protein n=1 Tax=Muricoccus aerilatus TaxID=452982 RepID=UPI0012EC5A64|nr:hypothetical protein [Roseomonas aerilata]